MVSKCSMTALAAAAALASVMLAPTQAAAQAKCDLAIEPAQEQWIIRYNPFEDEIALRQFEVRLVNRGATPCNGNILATLQGEAYGLTSPNAAGRVDYELIDDDFGRVDIAPVRGQVTRNGVSVKVDPGEHKLARLTFIAHPGDGLSRGLYTQTLSLFVQHANDTIHASRPIVLGLDVAASTVMGLKGEFSRVQGRAVIDLGELATGTRALNTQLYVHSTGGYRVTVSSANGGRLVQRGTAWDVEYSLMVGSHAFTLKAPSSFETPSLRARRDDYPLSIGVGDVTGKRAGDYSDTITFTVAAI
ncbi:hypothetical protein D8I30_09350 [Brevundimonas naejangsanensis]|uniref:Spore coat protein U domain-containing protein n=1 Tax=Brevundimonas naejangsanensis TaxID=588932 RepID=A0A494RG58_9CAUL|nr:hypothetical protein [Brevundimonas naejangsanensis]AYG95358.1 hypothetical protein D8I30_09350 [Brevundimonas naejangsanensis]